MTKMRFARSCAAILSAMLTSSTVCGQQDDASLKSAHDAFVRLWMAGDIPGIERRLQPRALGFVADSASATDFDHFSPARRQQAVRSMLALGDALKVAQINMKFRTFNETGIVWGYYKIEYTDQKRTRHTADWRTIEVYTMVSGQWLLAAWHVADVPTAR